MAQRSFSIIVCTALFLTLTSCAGLLGTSALRLLLVRGGAAELSGAAIRYSLGGEAIAASRAAQIGLGSAMSADIALSRLATSRLQIQVGQGAAIARGHAAMRGGAIEVTLGDAGVLRVTRPIASRDGIGTIANQYVGSRQVGYSRFSPDNVRIDYFARVGETNSYEPFMYALRDPEGRSVAFFGRNHRYLGKATYVTRQGRLAGDGVAGALAIITLSDVWSASLDEQCSPQLLILRRTYYNQGISGGPPDQFWQSMYDDCGAVPSISAQYQLHRLNAIRAILNPIEKLAALEEFHTIFPNNQDATNLIAFMRRGI